MSQIKHALPEILAPAGDMGKLETALLYGADAVYMGGSELSLRAKTRGFGMEDLPVAFTRVRNAGARAYFTLNILPHERHLNKIVEYLEHLHGLYLAGNGPHGLILADPGVVRLAHKHAPDIPIHLSTQANTSNSASLEFWKDQGVARVNLARELDLKAIRTLAQSKPCKEGLELELFVHGAMCMALSGRCLMSAYLNDRSANLGLCTHPCRYDYGLKSVTIEEHSRPGRDLWEVREGDEYRAVLAAEDLCLIKYTAWFMRVGVHALKIEGRIKTEGYVAQTVDAYKTALTHAAEKRFEPEAYLHELENAATRTLGSGFFLPSAKRVLWTPQAERLPILAKVLRKESDGAWRVAVRSPWNTENGAQLLVPGLKRPVLEAQDYALESTGGDALEKAHPGVDVVLRCELPDVREGLFFRALSA